jgi:hypothetical protein
MALLRLQSRILGIGREQDGGTPKGIILTSEGTIPARPESLYHAQRESLYQDEIGR